MPWMTRSDTPPAVRLYAWNRSLQADNIFRSGACIAWYEKGSSKCSAWNILLSTSTDGAAKRELICICCLEYEGNQEDDYSLPL